MIDDWLTVRPSRAAHPITGAGHNCAALDLGANREHRDCAHCFAAVYLHREGEGRDEITVPTENGLFCPRCREVVCSDCTDLSLKTEQELCVDCVAVERKDIETAEALQVAAIDAKSALARYLTALPDREEPRRLADSLDMLNEARAVFREIACELVSTFERTIRPEATP